MLFRNQLIIAKAETTYGVDAGPTAAANAILCGTIDVSLMQGTTVERDQALPTLGNDLQYYAAPYTQITFRVELAASGTPGVAPAWGVLLKACGFAETVIASTSASASQSPSASASPSASESASPSASTGASSSPSPTPSASVSPSTPSEYTQYVPVSSSFGSCTLWFYHDLVLHKLTGARGNVTFNLSAQAIPYMQFTIMGMRVAESATTMPTDYSFAAFQTPIPVNNTNTPIFQLHSYDAKMSALTVDAGQQVEYRNIVNDEAVLITDRASTGEVTIDEPEIGTKNFHSIIAAHTTGNLLLYHGTTDGYQIQLSAPAVQLLNPRRVEVNGQMALQMGMRLIPSSGNDELVLTVH